MKLSNQGHKMAEIEGLVAQSVEYAGGDLEKFKNMTFMLDGKSYSAEELNRMVGIEAVGPTEIGKQDILGFGMYESASGAFMNLYNQAKASGALNDPLASSTVTSAVTPIMQIGETFEDVVFQFTDKGAALNSLQEANTLAAKKSTNLNSSAICQAGSFTDNGVLCSP